MGKGDKKTKRGKITMGTFGVRRPRKKSKPIVVIKKKAVAKATADKPKTASKAKPKATAKPKTTAEAKPKTTAKPKATTKAKPKAEPKTTTKAKK